jgi:hypothetical protein
MFTLSLLDATTLDIMTLGIPTLSTLTLSTTIKNVIHRLTTLSTTILNAECHIFATYCWVLL